MSGKEISLILLNANFGGSRICRTHPTMSDAMNTRTLSEITADSITDHIK